MRLEGCRDVVTVVDEFGGDVVMCATEVDEIGGDVVVWPLKSMGGGEVMIWPLKLMTLESMS